MQKKKILIRCLLVFSLYAFANNQSGTAEEIRITLLGTGTPSPNVERFGPAVLVEGGGKRLLFDCGRGAVIRLTGAGVPLTDVDTVFLTHLHSDHIVGIPDLWLSGWLLGRSRPLKVWGPTGTRAFTQGLVQAFAFDVKIRQLGPQPLPPSGAEIDANEINEGTAVADGQLRISAFVVDHGPVRPALGYRIDFAGRAVVISGDTKLSENLIEHAKGVDCLIHAAWSVDSRNPTPRDLRSLASAEDAALVFSRTKPKLAVIYHYFDSEGLVNTVRAGYKGRFILGKDLMVIRVAEETNWSPRSAAPRN